MIKYFTSRYKYYRDIWKWWWDMPVWYDFYKYHDRPGWKIAMDRWDAREPKWENYK